MDNIEVKNVARHGRAWQSSTSKWSQPDDPLRALNDDGRRDFSFHTDKEDTPWWMVDLGRNYPIETIIIENRRKGYQDCARSLCVELSDDDWNWTPVYSAYNKWGSLLHLNLGSDFSARYIRLSLREKNYFHLAGVKVLVRSNLMNLLPRKISLARRSDGLGERLNAIVNALSLANTFGLDFRFIWPSSLTDDTEHAIEAASDFFDADFLKRFEIDNAPSSMWELDGKGLTLSEARSKLHKLNGFIGPRLPLSGIFDKTALSNLALDLPKAFNSIKFSPRIATVIERARLIPLKENAVGMHLRAGDIFYGDYRKRVHYTYKGLTLPIAKAILKQFQAEGKTVYLFGQDDDVISHFCESYGAESLAAIDPEAVQLGRVEKAMYDLVAMSRFPIIAAGTSGFAKQAQWIGGSVVKEPKDFFTAQQQHQIITDDLAKNADIYHPLQTAFAYWYAYYYGRHSRSDSKNTLSLEKAAKYDTTNELYPIALIYFALKAENPTVASEWFTKAFGDGNDDRKLMEGLRVLSGKTMKVYNLQEFIPTFMDKATSSPHAAFLAWAFSTLTNRPVEAEHYRALAGQSLERLFFNAEALFPHLSSQQN